MTSKLVNHLDRCNGMVSLTPIRLNKHFSAKRSETEPSTKETKTKRYVIENKVVMSPPLEKDETRAYYLDGKRTKASLIAQRVNMSTDYFNKATRGFKSLTINGRNILITRSKKITARVNLIKGDIKHLNITRKEASYILDCSPSYICQCYGKEYHGWKIEKIEVKNEN